MTPTQQQSSMTKTQAHAENPSTHRRMKSKTALLEALESRTLYSATPQIIGYLPDYEFSKFITTSNGTVTSDTVAWKNLTQINYFSLEPSTFNSGGQLRSTGALSASTSSGFDYTQQLPSLIKEAANNGVRVNVTIGGGDGASISEMTALVRSGQTAWQNFATSLQQMIATESAGVSNLPSGGVGVDLDWEPVDGSVSSVDVANYGKMIQTLRQQMPNLRLSAAVLAGQQGFTDTSARDYVLSPTAVQNLTSINVMDYQLDAQQAPVTEAEGYMAAWASHLASTSDALTGTAVGGSASQLNFGVPFYGVGNNGASFATYPQILSGTRVATTSDYIETDVAGTDYYSDSPTTLAAKVDYALDHNYGGVMAWEMGQDSLPESGTGSLLSAVKTAVDNHGGTTPTTGSVSGSVKTGSGTAIANVTVYLDANGNSTLDTGELHTTTNSSGAFSFSSVPTGAYTVRQVLPSGDTQTSPGSNAGHTISVTAGGNLTGENFTDTLPASTGSVSGSVKTSSLAGIAGVTVYLDANNNGKLDTGELHTTTNASGAYTFSNVPIHAYTIRQVVPSGDSQSSPASNAGHAISVTAGANLANENFTDTVPTGSVTGTVKTTAGKALVGVTVFLDANGNGKLDTGELHTTTNSSGVYTFSTVPIGAYTVRQSVPTGETQSSPASNAGHAITVTKNLHLANENFTDAASAPVKLTGTIISASVSNNSTRANAFDGNLSTTFHGSAASGNWLGLDLGTAKTLTQIKFAAASADPYNMEGGIFQGSNTADFSTGTVTLYAIPNTSAPSSTSLTTVNVSGKFRYVRYLAPAASFGDLAEIQFFGMSA